MTGGLPEGFTLELSTIGSSTFVVEVTIPAETWFAFSYGEGMCQTDILYFVAHNFMETPVADLYAPYNGIPDIDNS